MASAQLAKGFATQIKKLKGLVHSPAEPGILADFDEETAQLITNAFGETSRHQQAYELATVGEAESLVNMPQPAQEDAAQNIPRKAIEQRRQVLEACIAELVPEPNIRRSKATAQTPVKRKTGGTTSTKVAIKAKVATKAKSTAGKIGKLVLATARTLGKVTAKAQGAAARVKKAVAAKKAGKKGRGR